MPLRPVSDPALLGQLNASGPALRPVSDPAVLAQLNGEPPKDERSWLQRGYEFSDRMGEEIKSATIRPLLRGLGALPIAAMNAGVGARNLLTGSDYELPGETFNKALDEVTIAPQTGLGKAAEFVSSALIGAAVPAPTAATQVPANFVRPAANGTQQVLREAQDAGFVAPPTQANPTFKARMAEAAAGKTSVQQGASVRNQGVMNSLAKKALGLTDDQPLNRETLSGLREEAGKVYRAVADTGEIVPDGQFLDELSQLGRASDEIAKDFPDANVAASDEIGNLVNSLLRDKFSAKSALEYLKELRKQASSNLSFQASADPGKRALGMAQREAAATLEDLMTRHLAAQGKPELAQAFDEARRLIAKTYSVESALNETTGNIVASSLSGQLRKGKPLSGELEMIAKFSRAFPKATRETNESFPLLSPWDFGWGGIGSMAAGNPLPAAYPFARMAARAWLLSPGGQRIATGQGMGGVNPRLLMGTVAPVQGLGQ